MANTPSISLFSIPIGDFTAVTLAGQGDINMIPIFSEERPVLSIACFLALIAARSTGAYMGRR